MKEKKGMSKAPIFVGVDDGHYSIKVIADIDGEMASVSIPSRAASGRQVISVNQDEPSFYETEEAHSFTVNEHLQNSESTRFTDYPRSELNRVLVHHALRQAGLGGRDVIITTGLPVSYYYLGHARNEKLIDDKTANLQKRVVCGNVPLANIKGNSVTTEAIAAYFDAIMDMDGVPTPFHEEFKDEVIGVIDIGGKTTDCAVIFPGGEQVDTQRSGSNDVGVLMLFDAVEAKLRTRFDLDNLPPKMVERAISNGVVRVSGQEHDVLKEVVEEKEKLAEKIMSGVRTKIGSGKDLATVLFVGGGAIVMREQLAKHYPHHRFPDQPEFANARGMFKISKYVFGGEE